MAVYLFFQPDSVSKVLKNVILMLWNTVLNIISSIILIIILIYIFISSLNNWLSFKSTIWQTFWIIFLTIIIKVINLLILKIFFTLILLLSQKLIKPLLIEDRKWPVLLTTNIKSFFHLVLEKNKIILTFEIKSKSHWWITFSHMNLACLFTRITL